MPPANQPEKCEVGSCLNRPFEKCPDCQDWHCRHHQDNHGCVAKLHQTRPGVISQPTIREVP